MARRARYSHSKILTRAHDAATTLAQALIVWASNLVLTSQNGSIPGGVALAGILLNGAPWSVWLVSQVYCLPEGYEVVERSLDDIRYVLDPTFTPAEVRLLQIVTLTLRVARPRLVLILALAQKLGCRRCSTRTCSPCILLLLI